MSFFAKNQKNLNDFRRERGLYIVEPLVDVTVSWLNFDDVHDMRMSTKLHFETLKGKNLYAKHLLKEGEHYWKLFIVNEHSQHVHILYVQASSLNPVRSYSR